MRKHQSVSCVSIRVLVKFSEVRKHKSVSEGAMAKKRSLEVHQEVRHRRVTSQGALTCWIGSRRHPDSLLQRGDHQGAKRLTENFAAYEATMSLHPDFIDCEKPRRDLSCQIILTTMDISCWRPPPPQREAATLPSKRQTLRKSHSQYLYACPKSQNLGSMGL